MANEDLQHDHDDDLDEDQVIENEHESDDSDGDSRTKEESEDQHEDHQDDEIDPERKAIQQRRREERARKKQVQREREEALKRQLDAERHRVDELSQRLAMIERRSTGSEIAQLDAKIKEASDASGWYKAKIAEAAASGQHDIVADATEKMMLAREEAARLVNIKGAYNQQQQRPQTIDPVVAGYGKQFLSDNKWIDLQGRDDDSRVALTIDAGLTRDGWDPRTPQYWEEYNSRIKKYLPHRSNSGSVNSVAKKESRKSVVTGSGRESTSGASKGGFNLSPERVQALKDAGAWNDEGKRAKMIKAYRDYDKQNRS